MVSKGRMVARVAAVVAASIVTVAVSAAQAEEWRGWNIHDPDYPVSAGMEAFGDKVRAATGGEIDPKTFHNAVLGSQPDAIEQVRVGAIDFAVFNMGPLGQVVPAASVVSLPFIFKGMDHMHRVMDGPIGEEIGAHLAEKGLQPLAWYDSGARSFYNTAKPIASPDDVKGMKIRVMNNDLFVKMIEAMGGNATPMAFSEVYQSLKTGVIDGAENNWPSYESTNHYEVAGYYSTSEHLIIPECLCVNKKTWDSLSADTQAAVKQAARESADLQREAWAKRAEQSREQVLKAGVKFNEITDKSAFQNAMASVYETFLTDHPDLRPLVEKIKATD
ncbi:TRAP transporter substrate-binding protein [Pacificispira sp.]|uniref:TRAP transporter substrate-binding protein n=1 Tax=Pacificispira sp. TaxID=2888761 RepID=UPI003BACDBA2